MGYQVPQHEYVTGEDGELRLAKENIDLRENLQPSNDNEGWALSTDSKLLYPTTTYTHQLNSWLCERDADDYRIRFLFGDGCESDPMHISESRLTYIGGPLAYSVANTSAVNGIKEIKLGHTSDPVTFSVIKDFLYARPIELTCRSLSQLRQIIILAHDLELRELVRSLCKYLRVRDMIMKAQDVLAAQNLITYPDVPLSFKIYYWDRVARRFDEFMTTDVIDLEDPTCVVPPVQSRMCPRFPNLWELALLSDTVQSVMYGILRFSKRNLKRGLLDVILQYLEPRIEDDGVVCSLIEILNLKSDDYLRVLEEQSSVENSSARAVRLLAKTMATTIARPAPVQGPPKSQEGTPEKVEESRIQWEPCRYAWHCRWQKSYTFLFGNKKIRRKVAFSPLSKSESEYHFSGNQAREPERNNRSIAFQLQRKNYAEGIDIDLTWHPGPSVRNGSMAVALEVWENNCECISASSKRRRTRKRECLGSHHWNGGLSQNGSLKLSFDSRFITQQMAKHKPVKGCCAVITLTVGVRAE